MSEDRAGQVWEVHEQGVVLITRSSRFVRVGLRSHPTLVILGFSGISLVIQTIGIYERDDNKLESLEHWRRLA